MEKKKIIYQVLPRLWGNGRFSAWEEDAFSHLHSLGVDAVWYTGIPRHASGESFVKGNPGSPYAVCDWMDVNPYLADDPQARMEEFRSLVERTHKAGFKCITDFIPNHTACNYSGPIPLLSYCDGDWTDTLKVDWSDAATEAAMLEVLLFWAGVGVDGFRCDMVELVPPESLRRIIEAARRKYPQLLFIAEVYDRNNYRRYLSEVGFDLLYDKSGCYDILRGIIEGRRSARELSWNWQFLGDMQSGMLNFLENHDEQRMASVAFAATPDRAWAALAYAALFNTASFMIYAGQEAGEDAGESDNGRTSIFNWSSPRMLSELSRSPFRGECLDARGKEVLKRYRSLMALASSPLFREGSVWDLCYCNTGTPGFNPDLHTAFVRYDASEAVLVVCNFAPQPLSASIALPEELRKAGAIAASCVETGTQAHSYSIYNIKNTYNNV